MVADAKIGVDWTKVRALYETGVSVVQLSKQFDLSRQAIYKRHDREAWGIKGQAKRHSVDKVKLSTLTRLTDVNHDNLADVPKHLPVSRDKDTPFRREKILEALRLGLTFGNAAQCAGVHVDTLDNWRKADLDFQEACEEARSYAPSIGARAVMQTAERGDWRAGAYILEHHDSTKEQFGTRAEGRAPSVTVNIGADRNEPVIIEN